MQALLTFFAELCALRRAPQDLPASQLLFAVVLLADLAVGVLVGVTSGISWLISLMQGTAEVFVTLVALYTALNLVKHPGRFLQSATALLGSGAFLGIIAIFPLSLNPTSQDQSNLAAIGAFLLLALVVWSMVVTGHILRHTFALTLGQGVAIAFGFEILTVTLVTGLFGSA